MSDALPLPPRPDIGQYKKLARELQRACQSKEPDAVRAWAARWAEAMAQLRGGDAPQQKIDWLAAQLAGRWEQLRSSNGGAARCTLTAAQFFIARTHGFASWPKFAAYVEAVARVASPVARFERAADAIVGGDTAALRQLIEQEPELVRARSEREHRSTLLHYVSANGVEDFRQKTPPNIVEIARLLLDSGADVNAESEAYGGRSTALGLTATSWHPEHAGVQIPLLQLLLERGAAIDLPEGGSTVSGCLHNGRGEAAEFLASRGARLDLEGAAGVGRLDTVRELWPTATGKQRTNAFAWACEFGRTQTLDYLVRQGMAVDAKLPHNGQTGLHWAALGGHAETVRLLLDRRAPVDRRDESFGGTPLHWALYGWAHPGGRTGPFYETVALLARAGATLEPEWFTDDDAERQRTVQRLRSDERMQAALRGRLEG